MTDIKSMNKEELKDLMVQVGEKPFRAKQIYSWLHEHLVTSYEEMGNIPGKLKEKLKEYPITALEMVDEQISAIDGTRKYLFRLSDGNVIESVLMRYKHGNSVCISSQVGCKMGCRFCASTIGGWTRNLLPSEMLDQIYRIQADTGERVANVVVMGTGEPMDNYDNLGPFYPDTYRRKRTWHQSEECNGFYLWPLFRKCMIWQKRNCRSRWRFLFMRLMMRNVRN